MNVLTFARTALSLSGATVANGDGSTHRFFSLAARARLLGILIALTLSHATAARATTYYVATNGNDGSSGQQGAPWRTIGKAASAMGAGDTAIIAGGTYAEMVTQRTSGTPTAPIIFTAAAGATPVIDGTSVSTGAYGALFAFSNASYVRLSGLTIRNSHGFCVELSGNSTHVDVGNLDVSNCASSGAIWVEGSTVAAFSRIHDCRVHDNPQGGIVLWNSPGGYYLIENNAVWNNAGNGNFDGIQVGGYAGGLHHVVVRNNVSHDNGTADPGADQIDMGGHSAVSHYLMEGNDAYGVGGSVKVHGQPNRYSIARFNRATGFGFIAYDRPNSPAIYNNSVVDAGTDVMFWTDNVDAGGTSFGGMELRNNLFVNSSNFMLIVAGVSGASVDTSYASIRLDGNMYRPSSEGFSWYPRDFNCQLPDPTGVSEFLAFQAANAPNLQEVRGKRTMAAPGAIFANPAGRDYHLISGSPAIDAGIELTTTRSSGTQVTTIPVRRSSFFQDGYGGLIAPDQVQVGRNSPVSIVAVDDANNLITVASPVTFAAGDPVNLPYNGAAPDVGAYESTTGAPAATATPIRTGTPTATRPPTTAVVSTATRTPTTAGGATATALPKSPTPLPTAVGLGGTCASPIVIPAAGGVVTGTTSGQSSQQGSCAPTWAAPERVYVWTPAVSGTATLQTCSTAQTTFDTTLYVRGSTCAGGTELVCNDDTTGCGTTTDVSNPHRGSRVTLSVTAGQPYYLFVDGYSGASGAFVLSVSAPSGPVATPTAKPTPTATATAAAANACAAVTMLPSQGGTVLGTTSGQNTQAGSCAPTNAAPERVYGWVPSKSGTATIQTCSQTQTKFDTVLYVRDAVCQGGAEVACNDDTTGCGTTTDLTNPHRGSRTTLSVTAGHEYFIFVDGYNAASGGSSGQFALTVTPP